MINGVGGEDAAPHGAGLSGLSSWGVPYGVGHLLSLPWPLRLGRDHCPVDVGG